MYTILHKLKSLILIILFFYFTQCRDSDKCSLIVDSGICIADNRKILLGSPQIPDLSLHLTFDESNPVDSSGFGNHPIGSLFPGPGFSGFGSSALFRQSYFYIPHFDSLNAEDFTYTFYIFILYDIASLSNSKKYNQFCPGFMMENAVEASPAILINPKNGQIKIAVSFGANFTKEFTSNFRLLPSQWYHFALIKQGAKFKLYLNGILDSSETFERKLSDIDTDSDMRSNSLSLFIGGAPYAASCDLPILLDEFKYYTRALGVNAIQAEASIFLGGIEPSFIYFGCFNCSKEEGKKSCPSGYHLCNKIELYAGGYQVVKRFGLSTKLVMISSSPEPDQGIALCCRDIPF